MFSVFTAADGSTNLDRLTKEQIQLIGMCWYTCKVLLNSEKQQSQHSGHNYQMIDMLESMLTQASEPLCVAQSHCCLFLYILIVLMKYVYVCYRPGSQEACYHQCVQLLLVDLDFYRTLTDTCIQQITQRITYMLHHHRPVCSTHSLFTFMYCF